MKWEEPTHQFSVEAETYTSEYTVLAPDLYVFRRLQQISVQKEEVDAFGNFWGLAIGDLLAGQVRVKRGDEWIDVVGHKMIWLPPHSSVCWQLSPGPLEWFSYMSPTPPPINTPREPIMFSLDEFTWPTNRNELFQLLEQARDIVPLTPPARNPWAIKLKRKLDQEFHLNIKMEDYAVQFGIAPETLTRSFHDEYGLPPVQFKNKIRVLQAMVDILVSGQSISDVSQNVGFKDQSHFNQLFRREIRSRPVSFKN